MTRVEILNKVVEIIKAYCPANNLDLDKNIFSSNINCNSRDSVLIFLDIEKIFDIDLNQLIKSLDYVSINKLVTSILSLQAQKI